MRSTSDLPELCKIPAHPAVRRNPEFYATAYQACSSGVHLAALLLVERSAPESLQNGVEIVIEDLEANILGLPAILDGCKVLRKILQIYDHRGAAGTPELIASEIGPVFGGESTARKYLCRCDINYLLNQNQPAFTRGTNDKYGKPVAGLYNPYELDVTLDMLGPEQWEILLNSIDSTLNWKLIYILHSPISQ